MRKKEKFIFFFLISLFFFNIVAWAYVFDFSQPSFLRVIFFNIGQGDAIFIEISKRQQILIDGGPSAVILEKLAKEISFFDRTIDLIVLTHPEKDHLIGLLEVLKRYKVENIFWTGVFKKSIEYEEWLNLIEKEKAGIEIVFAGRKIIISDVIFEIFHPSEELKGQEIKNSNDSSIVGQLRFGEVCFLFTGDISQKSEKEIISKQTETNHCKFRILKVAHHGSKYSTSEDFLKKFPSQLAIISVGENSYGHPTSEVLNRLENFGIKILRTDKNDDIEIITNGKNFKIK